MKSVYNKGYGLILAGLWLFITSISLQAKEPEFEQLSITTTDGTVIEYRIEVARTPTQMQRGLMFRDHMPEDQGMLFIYVPERPARMWMKNTILSLDMLFINADGIIINIAQNTIPFSIDTIESGGPVRAVVELNAGQVARHNIAAGNQVTHPLFAKE